MKTTGLITLALIATTQSSHANNYTTAKQTLNSMPTAIQNVVKQAPSVYEFDSRFTGGSSVSYPGQVFRQVLINDLKSAMGSQLSGSYAGTKSEAMNMLNSYFGYDESTLKIGKGAIDGISEFGIKAYLMDGTQADFYEGFFYSDIQSPGKNLKSKIAGVDNSLRRGKLYGTAKAQTPQDLVQTYFDEYATNLTSGQSFEVPNGQLAKQTVNLANVSKKGYDLAQLTQKFLHGAVSYSQAARDYLSIDLGATKGLNADNSAPAKQGSSYTAMEHHFDEGFGYFGAARDFLAYSDLDVARKLSVDTNNDGLISVLTELNQGISVNTAKIDYVAADQKVDFSTEAMDAFIKGRHLINEAPQNYKTYVVAYANVALGAWEKTLAAVVVHYINKTISEYDQYGTVEYLYKDFVKFWSELKGYAFSFQFNPNGMMSDANFDQLHQLVGDQPVLPHAGKAAVDAYKADLLKARDILQATYQFSDLNTKKW